MKYRLLMHTYSTTGVYTACLVMTNECDRDSVCKDIGVYIGIEERFEDHWNINPNPADQTLVLNMKGAVDLPTNLTVYDGTDRIMLQRQCTKQISDLNVSNLENGIYLIRMTSREGKTTEKQLLIKH